MPALIKGRATPPVARTDQDGDAVYGGHPKAIWPRLYGGYRPAIAAVTAFGGIPADQLAIWVDVGMGPCGNDSGEDGREACRQDCA